MTDEQRIALLDHELCHAAPMLDDRTQEQVVDERGRKVWRMVKHDIEEFGAIVQRHGLYKADLEKFGAEILKKARTEPHTPCEQCADSPGWLPVVVDGVPRNRRCKCYLDWAEKRAEAMAS